MIIYQNTIIGEIGIMAEAGHITRLILPGGSRPAASPHADTPADKDLINKAFIQLKEYLSGQRQTFSLPLAPAGTPFQQQVWQALLAVPYGKTASYKDIAVAVGNPRAVRAVGGANNRNPIAIFIPCHRIVGADGSLVGYGGGLTLKKFLLESEKRMI